MLKAGDRVKLVRMDDDPDPVPIGMMGTVLEVLPLPFHHETELLMKWDNGRTLSVILPKDQVQKVE